MKKNNKTKIKSKTIPVIKSEDIGKVPIPEFVRQSEKVRKAKLIIPYLFLLNKFFIFFTLITCFYALYIYFSLPAPTLLVTSNNGNIKCSNKYYDPNSNSIINRETDYYENFCDFLDKRGDM